MHLTATGRGAVRDPAPVMASAAAADDVLLRPLDLPDGPVVVSPIAGLHALPWGLLPRHPVAVAWAVLSDCWLLTVALWRQLRDRQDNIGAFRGIAFDAGADDDPRAATRRAAYTAVVSLAPNTYVVGIDRENNNMLVHELVPGPRETTRQRVLGKL